MSIKQTEPIQAVLKVSRKEYLTPHYIRVYLSGDDVLRIADTTVGVNNKILIPPKGSNEIRFPEFDYEKMQWKPQLQGVRPVIRTYTHRGINLEQREIWIDFVAHGTEGPASAWAIEAKEGDVLGVLIKEGQADLYTRAGNYILVGDATAIPVLGAILEDLPATAKGACIIEVQDKEEEQHLPTRADIQFQWLYRPTQQKGSRLAEAVRNLELPKRDRFAYLAAEFTSVKEIRNYLRKEQHFTQEELYAYSYWKAGVTEDKSAMDRRKEHEAVSA